MISVGGMLRHVCFLYFSNVVKLDCWQPHFQQLWRPPPALSNDEPLVLMGVCRHDGS
jgi:hypothetical protein